MSETFETRLVVDRKGKGYTARWVESGGQESKPFPLALPLTTEDTDDLRWYLETYLQFPGAGDKARAQGIEGKLKDWGRALFDALFDTSEGKDVYRNLMDAPEPRLLTIGATDPDILVQPWEMMRDARGPLAFQGVSIRRQLQGARPPRAFALGLPVRVLLIVSRPADIGFIDPRNSIPPILDALDALPGQAAVDFCDPPTLAQLEKTISRARKAGQPYHIVHFDGHGTYLPKTGVGALAFERDDATTHLVPGTQLGDLLARLDVPLVLLEACRSSDLSDRPVFGSVAPALLESGVGSVVAFSHAVHVEAARILVERFYRELAAGLTVGQSLGEARTALRANPRRWLHLGPDAETVDLEDWFIPQLYQVGDDPKLVNLSSSPRPPSPPLLGEGKGASEARGVGERLSGFPPPPMYRFHGRAMELLALERAFRQHPAVVVTGMSGMGKTALAREAAAWWLRKGRFAAAVFCSFEQRAGAERVVQLLGQALEGDEFSARSADDQWRTAVALFHQRPVLLVWDNFESTLPIYQHDASPSQREGAGGRESSPLSDSPLQFDADARARLLQLYRDLTVDPLPAGRLLVTCRPQETGLPAVKEFPLEGLARPDSLHLLAAVCDLKGIPLDRPGYERAEVNALLDDLADHPLSVELVAPHLKTLTPAEIRRDYGPLLARFADETAYEGRNRSLLASLEFSKRRLSDPAQAALPTLAWFHGGVFEQVLLGFANLEPATWEPIRAELTATALVSVEELEGFTSPYLRFHPTLPYAARAGDVPDPEKAEERFIAVYLGVMQMAHDALRGRQPAAGMALVACEEANLRAALAHAFQRGDRQAGWQMAETLGIYLERAGRLRERDALVSWVRAQSPDEGPLDEATWAATLDQAWSLFTQGRAAEAVQQVQGLIQRLETEGLAGGSDPTFQIAMGYSYLGKIYVNARRPDLALAPAQKAITLFEKLPGDVARGNLAAALGDLANAYCALGQFDAALAAAGRAATISRELGRDREVAAALGITANILAQQQRYAEAEAAYGEALRAAGAAGDRGLQGAILQHQGALHRQQGRHDRAVDLFKQAIAIFQQAADTEGEMQTCDLLATAERERGHLDAAAAWYARSRELAGQLGDRAQLAANAQNVGILHQTQAEQASDPAARAVFLRQAVASVEESLAVWLDMDNQVNAAAAYSQLGILYQMLGELDQAKKHARQALRIRESLNLPDVYKDYGNLACIARDRGDAAAAARWQAKRDAKVAELERLRRGGQDPKGFGKPLGSEMVRFVLALAQAAYQARVTQSALDPEAAEALAQLADAPPPINTVGTFLQAVAAGKKAPAVPAGLPPDLAQILSALAEAVG